MKIESRPVVDAGHAVTRRALVGGYRFTVGEESFDAGPGDAFLIPPGVTHGCRLIEGSGVPFASFTPRRKEPRRC